MFITAVLVVVGLVGLLASIVYLVDFALASRGDNPYRPATTRSARRARRVTGMYVRGGDTALAARARNEEAHYEEARGDRQLVAH